MPFPKYKEVKFACACCSSSYKSRAAIVLHLRFNHGSTTECNSNRHECSYCNASFRQRSVLANHLRSHLKASPFKCSICTAAFKQKSSLTLHFATAHHRSNPAIAYECGECMAKFVIRERLILHQRTHIRDRPRFKCAECHITFAEKRNLRQHQLSQHNPNRKRIFKCDSCSSRFFTKRLLQNHMFSHTQDRPFQCHVCDVAYRQQKTLRCHVARCHPETRGNAERFVCAHCARPCFTPEDLRKHIQAVHRNYYGKRFGCSQCQRQFVSADCVYRHIQYVHSPKAASFACQFCPRLFKKAVPRISHEQRMHQQNPILPSALAPDGHMTHRRRLAWTTKAAKGLLQCAQCGAIYRNRVSLLTHLEGVHENNQWIHQCSTCLMHFRKLRSLYAHQRHCPDGDVHRQRKYFCARCRSSFKWKHHLSQHLLVHSSERPFACKHCSQNYKSLSGLLAHTKSAHAIARKFHCCVCGDNFSTKPALVLHLSSCLGS